jgi:hypothetical protein
MTGMPSQAGGPFEPGHASQARTEPARILRDLADALHGGHPVPGVVTLSAAA